MKPLLLPLLLATGACVSWQRDPDALKGPIPPKQTAEVWVAGQPYRTESLTVAGDSVHAKLDPVFNGGADSALVFSTVAIDSVVLRRPAVGGTIVLVAATLLAALGFAIQQSLSGPGS